MIRADPGFCCELIMAWCEEHQADYVLELAKNERLNADIVDELEQAKQQFHKTGSAARVYKDFEYQTLKS